MRRLWAFILILFLGFGMVEITAKRTERSKTYSLGGNRFAVDTGICPLHYKEDYSDPRSLWIDIDPTIQADGKVSKAPYDLEVYLTGIPGFRYTSKRGGTVDIRLGNLKKTGEILSSVIPSNKSPVLKGNTATWAEILPGIDVQVVATPSQAFLRTIIKSADALSLLERKIDLEYPLVKTDGNFAIKTHIRSGDRKAFPVSIIEEPGKLIERCDLTNATFPITIDPTVDEQVGANADDGQEEPIGVTWNISGDPEYNPDTELGNYTGNTPTTAYRMQLTVPQGATIDVAYMSVRSGYTQSNSFNLKIMADDVDSAAVWGASPALPSERTPTTAKVDWDLSSVSWTEGTFYDSPSIVSVVQEIVSRGSWASDNYIGLIVKDDGTGSGNAHWGSDYSGNSAWGAKLHVEYTGDIELVVADATHAHSADNVALFQAHTLAVNAADHAHAADNIALIQQYTLAIAEALHNHSADNIVLTQAHILAMAEALHLHSSDPIALFQAHQIAMDDALHPHTADPIVLTQAHVLAIAEILHNHSSDPITLSQVHHLIVAACGHAHTADNIVLYLGALLVVQDALHAHTAENITLFQAHQLLVNAGLHVLASDPIALSQVHSLIVNGALHSQLADNIILDIIMEYAQMPTRLIPAEDPILIADRGPILIGQDDPNLLNVKKK